MKDIILASKSPYRKELLQRLGITFRCLNSNYDESPLKKIIFEPIELTKALSLEKAKSVQVNNPEAVIIGSDQVAHLNGKILGKPGSIEKAFEQISQLQGNIHELITSYVILYKDTILESTVTTKLFMRSLNEKQIKKYLSTDNPIDCAGSYKLELNGISLFDRIETTDQTAIIGLPLIALCSDLNRLGIIVPPEV